MPPASAYRDVHSHTTISSLGHDIYILSGTNRYRHGVLPTQVHIIGLISIYPLPIKHGHHLIGMLAYWYVSYIYIDLGPLKKSYNIVSQISHVLADLY